MKIKIKILAITLILAISLLALTACGTSYNDADNSQKNFCNGYFTQIKTWSDRTNNYYIVYDNETGVMYFVIDGHYQYGITPLYNADGTIQTYHKDR